MDVSTQAVLRNTLEKHIDNGINEFLEINGDINIWWPPGYKTRFAEIITQSIILIEESNTEQES